MLQSIYNLRYRLFRNIEKPLGRWSIDKCDASVSVVNYYSNVDHCGSCSYEHEIINSIMKNKYSEKERQKTKH